NGVPFTPSATTTYTVTGTAANGCTNTASVTITVNPLPSVSANASPGTTVCAGSSVTLSGSGASSYSWSGGVSNGVPFTPSATTTYTVTGTDANGCTNTTSLTISVKESPSVGIQVLPDSIICSGTGITLSGTGADSYSWSSGIVDGVAFYPTQTSTYTVMGTNANGCTDSESITIQVNNCASIDTENENSPIIIRTYPIPTDDFVYVELSSNNISIERISFMLYNTQGQLISTETEKLNNYIYLLDLRHYPSGIYFLTINHSNTSNSYKIIKN
ncbi:MAG: T9SS type A sorting domain-containing protein, partial [Flavobacteriales bacterium]|nr:T9SS type A sorting domain-containing protein [Flavobacteriales bacterium]